MTDWFCAISPAGRARWDLALPDRAHKLMSRHISRHAGSGMWPRVSKRVDPRTAVVLGVVALLAIVLPGSHLPSLGGPEKIASSVAASKPLATYDALTLVGYSPNAVALTWKESGDACFTKYEIDLSTGGWDGPWIPQSNITNQDLLSWVQFGFTPGEETWWRLVDYSGCGGGQEPSNSLSLTIPAVAALTYSDPTASSISLSWTNNAHYGGALTFGWYHVMESIDGGGFTQMASFTTESSTGYVVSAVSGLNTGASYQFYVITADECKGTGPYYCNRGQGTTTDSNNATQLAVDQPTASSTSVDVGQSILFSVIALGGTGPYHYNWLGLPPGCSSTDSNQTSCSPAVGGSSSVTVVVTDSKGIQETSLPVSVTVSNSFSLSLAVNPSTILEGVSTTFTATATGGAGGYRYQWTGLPPGCSGSGSTITCSPSSTGTFTITVTVMDKNGASAGEEVNLTVNPSFLGMPAVQGYAELGGGIAAAVIVAALVGVLLLRRRRAARSPPQQYQPPTQDPPPPSPPAT